MGINGRQNKTVIGAYKTLWVQCFSSVQVILAALIQSFSAVQIILSVPIQGSVLCKNFQELLVISACPRSALFKAALRKFVFDYMVVGIKFFIHTTFKNPYQYSRRIGRPTSQLTVKK